MTRKKQQERVRSQFALPDGYPCQMIQLNLSISILSSLLPCWKGMLEHLPTHSKAGEVLLERNKE